MLLSQDQRQAGVVGINMLSTIVDGPENQSVPIFCDSFSLVLFRREHMQLETLLMPGGISSQMTWYKFLR